MEDKRSTMEAKVLFVARKCIMYSIIKYSVAIDRNVITLPSSQRGSFFSCKAIKCLQTVQCMFISGMRNKLTLGVWFIAQVLHKLLKSESSCERCWVIMIISSNTLANAM